MATSRTGTATWKRLVIRAIARAKRLGITHCRHCGILLNYDIGRTPSSAEVDHLLAHANGGTDTLDNVEVICRRCNQSKGHRDAPKPQKTLKPLKTSRKW